MLPRSVTLHNSQLSLASMVARPFTPSVQDGHIGDALLRGSEENVVTFSCLIAIQDLIFVLPSTRQSASMCFGALSFSGNELSKHVLLESHRMGGTHQHAATKCHSP